MISTTGIPKPWLLMLVWLATVAFPMCSGTMDVASFPTEIRRAPGHTMENNYQLPLPHTYIAEQDLPREFTWGNVRGVSYLTHSRNQHLPQWCGSCWAHGSLSALADRIKIARNASANDINLSVQHLLNCGADIAGSCNGGSATGAYEFIQTFGYIAFDSCQPYLACSTDSTNGFCPQVDTTCRPENICRTCDMKYLLWDNECRAIEAPYIPNATVAEYGTIPHNANTSVHHIKAEILARGPVAAGVNGKPLHDYDGGIFRDAAADKHTTHLVSIVGWGLDQVSGDEYWIVRNSWGEYWGRKGFCYIKTGDNILGIEHEIVWATPGSFTVHNAPCHADGKNCGPSSQRYIDPAYDTRAVQQRLRK